MFFPIDFWYIVLIFLSSFSLSNYVYIRVLTLHESQNSHLLFCLYNRHHTFDMVQLFYSSVCAEAFVLNLSSSFFLLFEIITKAVISETERLYLWCHHNIQYDCVEIIFVFFYPLLKIVFNYIVL